MKNIRLFIISLILLYPFIKKEMEGTAFYMSASELSLSLEMDNGKLPVPDSISTIPPETELSKNWKYLAVNRELTLNDTTVKWPPFVKFCLDIYHWADRVFNTYDPAYIEHGKLGKAQISSDSWVDIYYFRPEGAPQIDMLSHIYSDLGANVSYGIVSLGYSLDMTTLFRDKVSTHKKLDFAFNCALFSFDIHYWKNTGGTFIRKFGDITHLDGAPMRVGFDGLRFSAFESSLFYFFNNKKFCYTAGYGSGNRQKKSQGTWIAGIDWGLYQTYFDFTRLPEILTASQDYGYKKYSIHYNSYCLLAGYSYNWVMNKHFMMNITTLPKIGLTVSSTDSTNGKHYLMGLGLKSMASLTYYNGRYFIQFTNNFTASQFQMTNIGYISAIENFQLAAGLRF